MIDLDELIRDLDNIPGSNDKRICDAKRVCKMWGWFKDVFGGRTTVYLHTDKVIVMDLMSKAEEKFFPLPITQNFEVQIQGKDDEQLHNTVNCIKSVWGVMEVRQSDKDCDC